MTAVHRVLLDNTVLTNFALAECASLVFRLWGNALCTTSRVIAEHREGVAQGSVPEGAWDDLTVIDLETEAEKTLLGDLPSNLGLGERTCLGVAQHRGGILATDDLYARKTAVAIGVTTTGSVGILIAGIRKELIDLKEGNRLLDLMIGHGYHSPVSSLDGHL